MNELIEKIEALPDNEYLGQYVSETNSPFCIGGNELKALVARLREAEAKVERYEAMLENVCYYAEHCGRIECECNACMLFSIGEAYATLKGQSDEGGSL